MDWKLTVTIAAMALVVATMVNVAWQHRRPEMVSKYLGVFRALRWTMVPIAVGNLAAIIVTMALLYQIPALQWGWWRLISGNNGNAMLGQTSYDGIGWRIAALAIPALLLLALPALALVEEEVYRRGSEAESWPQRIRRQLWFGLAHSLFAGVPIAAGIALGVGGLVFTTVYLRSFKKSEVTVPLLTPVLATPRGGAHAPASPWETFQERRASFRKAQDAAVMHAAALHALQNAFVVLLVLGIVISSVSL